MKILAVAIFVSSLCFSFSLFAQMDTVRSFKVRKPAGDIVTVPDEALRQDEVFTIVEDMPDFSGGDHGLLRYLGNIQYPALARENDIEGTVLIRFIVEKDGTVSNVEIARGSNETLDRAALEHVKKMPAWDPGRQRGKPVRVQYFVPINFKLQ